MDYLDLLKIKEAHKLDVYIESRDYVKYCAVIESANQRDLDVMRSLLLLAGVPCEAGISFNDRWKYYVVRTK